MPDASRRPCAPTFPCSMPNSLDFFGSQFAGPRSSPGFRLWKLHQEWQRKLNMALSAVALTQPQFSILAVIAWLGRTSDEVTQADVCRFAELERMQVSQICRKLEQLGYVDRVTASADIRAISLRLTDAGKSKLRETLPIVEDTDRSFFSPQRSLQDALISNS